MKERRLVIELAPKRVVRSEKKKAKKECMRVLPAWKGKALSLVALAATVSACSGQYAGSYDLVLLGNKEGLEKLTDYSAALVNEGKASPDTKSSHFQLREQQTGMEALKAKLAEMQAKREVK